SGRASSPGPGLGSRGSHGRGRTGDVRLQGQTHVTNEIEKSLLDIDFGSLTRRTFTPSPAAWEDQVLYFLLLDRFSDGNEGGGYCDSEGRPAKSGTTPLYTPDNLGRLEY